MRVHRSNRAEELVAVLADVVRRPLADAMAPECIVVQGRGMERWLSAELAQRLGVWANPDFPFPRRLVERALSAVLGDDADERSAFEPETLMWAIAALLPGLLDRPEFAPLRAYLADDPRGLKRMQLAERIADTFDHYTVYRPRLVLGWEAGDGTDWQPVLWRALVDRHGAHHVAARAAHFLRARRAGAGLAAPFPTRVSLFGVSTLPPLYLELLAVLEPLVELHVFLLAPSPEFWGDIRSRREIIRALSRSGAAAAQTEEALHLAEGNPLLASLGRLGRDFQQLLEAAVDYEDDERSREPVGTHRLAAIQSDILHLVHRTRATALPLPPDDSIGIHACHGPMREVEVVRDQLLALFAADPTLEARDIVVMTPSIDAYAPYIEAVFGAASDERTRIPYRIADRSVRATHEVVDAFAALVDVMRARMTATQVLDLLGIDAVRARFRIGGGDLDLLRTWVEESGIRWGVDRTHREAVGQPPLAENTWRFGLDRLLLGYAMPGAGRELFGGALPYDEVEGSSADLLGRLASFCDTLFAFRTALQTGRTLEAWRDDLGALLTAMIASTDQTAYQHQLIRRSLAVLAERAAAAGFDEPIDLDAVRAALEPELQRGAAPQGFLAGGVTFCELVPMRSIPFRVVCLLGMNDGAFPRTRRPLGFDLIAQRPLPGDRSSRDDDRYLFLEAVLSARDHLLITYVGQSITDNEPLPPSVVVSELLDALDVSFQPVDPPISPIVRHPLQAFSPRYFDGSDARLFSYSAADCLGARAALCPRQPPAAFLSAPLPVDVGPGDVVELDELVSFFDHPPRAFLQRRLGLYLGRDLEPMEDREPIVLNALDRWKIGDALLARALEGGDVEAAYESVRAGGRLPPGTLGRCLYDDIRPDIDVLAELARTAMGGRRRDPAEIDLDLDGVRLTGVVRDLYPNGHARAQYSQIGRRQELGLWIRHLALGCAAPVGSALIGRRSQKPPTVVRFTPVGDPRAMLQLLLRLYVLGRCVPLPLFQSTSRAYAEARREQKPDALAAARKKFDPDPYAPVPPDGVDPYVQCVYRHIDPLTDPTVVDGPALGPEAAAEPSWFAQLAMAVFGPLLAHRQEAP